MQSRAFERKADAEAWARVHESKMDAGTWRDDRLASAMSLSPLLTDYEAVRVPTMRSAADVLKQLQSRRASIGRGRVRRFRPKAKRYYHPKATDLAKKLG